MRVDGPFARGLWPPHGGRLCRRVVKGKVLRIDGPFQAQGFLSLTAFQAEGCGCKGFSRQRRHKKWRRRRRTSPAGTVSQPIGKPFNGQAKGLLWLTWRSYAGPPQYYITPESGALNPPVRRSRSQAELAAQGQRPGGWLNPHARKGVSTFGNTGKHRSRSRSRPRHKALVHYFFLCSSRSVSS